MSTRDTRGWGTGLGLAAAVAAAVVIGAGSAHADPGGAVDAATAAGAGTGSAMSIGSALDSVTASWDALAKQAEVSTNPADLLPAAETNLTDGVTALVKELFAEPTNQVLAQQVALQDGVLDGLGRLSPAEEAILAHTGSASNLVGELFFTPVNQDWFTASQAALSADQALADAIANGTGVTAAQFDALAASFQLLDAQFSSIPIEVAGAFFGAALTP